MCVENCLQQKRSYKILALQSEDDVVCIFGCFLLYKNEICKQFFSFEKSYNYHILFETKIFAFIVVIPFLRPQVSMFCITIFLYLICQQKIYFFFTISYLKTIGFHFS